MPDGVYCRSELPAPAVLTQRLTGGQVIPGAGGSAASATNTARVSSAQGVDPLANNSVTAAVRTVKPTLRLSKLVDRSTLRAGATATFTLRVRNPSARAVRNVRVCDRLPTGLVYVSANVKPKRTSSGSCWTIRSLPAASARTYQINVRALPGAEGRIVNRATASSPGANPARAARPLRLVGALIRQGGVTG